MKGMVGLTNSSVDKTRARVKRMMPVRQKRKS